MEQVKALAMTVGLGAYLKGALKLTMLRRCWRHSIGCALLAEKLAPAWGLSPEQAYSAGLLHDLGRLALLTKYPQPYADLLSVVFENRLGLLASERDLFEVDHCQAGAWLAGMLGSFPLDGRKVHKDIVAPLPHEAFDRWRREASACSCSVSSSRLLNFRNASSIVSIVSGVHGLRWDDHDDVAFARVLLERTKCAVMPGSAFGAPGHVRMCFGLSDARLDQGVERLRRLFAS